MSKKIKPVNECLGEAVYANCENSDKTVAQALAEKAPVAGGKFNDEVKAQLEKVEALEAELVKLTQENDELKEKLAEYIEKVSKLEAGQAQNGEKREKELVEENDKYLMKISELTFENAKLTAQNQQLKKDGGAPGKPMSNSNYPNVYRNYPDSNGYVSWN